jgi:glycosyltransferase involved in cell wall biosynthesis
MDSPPVSVIIPTYNRSDLVERAIHSVLDQTFEDFELIVVDDASDDDTPETVRAIDDDRIIFIRHDENKYGKAWNTGITNASGKYIAFLDDDDEWHPEKLAEQYRFFSNADDDVGLVYCWREVYKNGELSNRSDPRLSGDIFEETLIKNPIGNTSTYMIRAEVLDEIGGFDESLPCGLDSDLLRRLSKKYHVDYVPEFLVKQHWIHKQEQISDETSEKIYQSIESNKATLGKFGSYLETHSRKKSQLYARISRLYIKTGDLISAIDYLMKSIYTDPYSNETYIEAKNIGRLLRDELNI